MDKQKYRSYSQLFTQAVNQFFEKKEEPDLLPEIRKIIQEEMKKIKVVSVEKVQKVEEDIQKAMDFINSF